MSLSFTSVTPILIVTFLSFKVFKLFSILLLIFSEISVALSICVSVSNITNSSPPTLKKESDSLILVLINYDISINTLSPTL